MSVLEKRDAVVGEPVVLSVSPRYMPGFLAEKYRASLSSHKLCCCPYCCVPIPLKRLITEPSASQKEGLTKRT